MGKRLSDPTNMQGRSTEIRTCQDPTELILISCQQFYKCLLAFSMSGVFRLFLSVQYDCFTY